MSDFHFNTVNAKIQGLSIQVGELFADLYKDSDASASDVDNALEAYKSLRRLLPREYDNPSARHIGRQAAHKATQGYS